jgi:predicted DNA-binding transcriptional regulator YafY
MSKRADQLLGLVAAVVQEPGISIKRLAGMFGVSNRRVTEMVDSLSMVGIPPFGPDDFLDIWTENSEVRCQLPLSFGRPVRLNRMEASAMILAGKLFGLDELDAPAAMLWSSICQKICDAGAVTGLATEYKLSDLFESDSVPSDTGIFLKQWAEAAEKKQPVRVDFYNVNDGKTESETILPLAVEGYGGRYVLVGEIEHNRKTIDLLYIKRITKAERVAASADSGKEEENLPEQKALVRAEDFSLLEGFEYKVIEDSIEESFIAEVLLAPDQLECFCRRALAEFDRLIVLGPEELRGKLVEKATRSLLGNNTTKSN